jgi:hypothetical protein
MCIPEGIRNVDENLKDLPRLESAKAFNTLCKRFTVDEAHDEKDMTVDFVRAMDWNNVLVRERAGGSSLAQEPLADDWIGREMRWQCLDRDVPIEPRIAREVDDPHSAAPDLALDLVLPPESRTKVGYRVSHAEAKCWIGH